MNSTGQQTTQNDVLVRERAIERWENEGGKLQLDSKLTNSTPSQSFNRESTARFLAADPHRKSFHNREPLR